MKIVGVTSCPSGVAHTYMAAEALQKAGKDKGIEVHIETQGASGADDTLTKDQISAADFVVLTNDTSIRGTDRFKGKKVVQMSATKIIEKADALMNKLEKMA
ncbi:PTS fructose-like transporter subunit IIB [Paucilactobacillus suebicus]|uniref:PTS system fructose-like transporter subunit EIIB n=1 Tax=Paucilactobacillus suebicus DSM 5007 = KCTC 3549 TaxID=1423807 RepID=A0A0R1W118_9LACO|nr:PTS fructose-like transporter subunit IIB [Paucilactobacillus suebicus]KRM09059.1 PTS system fructose-like transporter subunit EIIB [Paucilactobacillus suebicus DSM 5007 = KCTC 3549]